MSPGNPRVFTFPSFSVCVTICLYFISWNASFHSQPAGIISSLNGEVVAATILGQQALTSRTAAISSHAPEGRWRVQYPAGLVSRPSSLQEVNGEDSVAFSEFKQNSRSSNARPIAYYRGTSNLHSPAFIQSTAHSILNTMKLNIVAPSKEEALSEDVSHQSKGFTFTESLLTPHRRRSSPLFAAADDESDSVHSPYHPSANSNEKEGDTPDMMKNLLEESSESEDMSKAIEELLRKSGGGVYTRGKGLSFLEGDEQPTTNDNSVCVPLTTRKGEISSLEGGRTLGEGGIDETRLGDVGNGDIGLGNEELVDSSLMGDFESSLQGDSSTNPSSSRTRTPNGNQSFSSFKDEKLTSSDSHAALLDPQMFDEDVKASRVDPEESFNPQAAGDSETFKFQAEVSKVMDIIVNSLYTNKDVFLRELMSNAADACDRKRSMMIRDEEDASGLGIRIKADKESKLLIIEDDGIGMSKQELISNLGTIAHSGTAKFLKQIAEEGVSESLIGKFGVGFYSSFLVAKKVEVYTRRYNEGDEQILRWSSSSGDTFLVTPCRLSDAFMRSGTRIVLHLKDDCDEYVEDYKLKELLRKYSEFIQFPIQIWSERVEYERVPDEDSSVSTANIKEKPRMKTVTKRFHEWERVNLQQPIWRQPEENLQEKDYFDFYKTTFKAYDNPLAYSHLTVEGQISFSAVLFVPGSLPWELSRNMFDDESRGIRLYVKRVFINDKFTEAIPRWLTFMRGVVDSNDLPLNVGREILQKSKMLSIINQRIAAKALDMIKGIKEKGKEDWDRFYENFGKYLKVGVVEDKDHQQQLASLIEFWSSNDSSARTSLDDYIGRMKENQKAIYFVAAETKKAAADSPALEKLRHLGYEVLYSTEPIDEFCLSSLGLSKYKGLEVIDANKADLKLPSLPSEDEVVKDEHEKKKIDLEMLCDWMHHIFGKKLQKVVVSTRLIDSPVLLVQGDFGLSPTMQKYVKQQAASQGVSEKELYGTSVNQEVMEINPNHVIIENLNKMVKADKSNPLAEEMTRLLYDVAASQGGYTVEDPGAFAKRIVSLMEREAGDSVRTREKSVENSLLDHTVVV